MSNSQTKTEPKSNRTRTILCCAAVILSLILVGVIGIILFRVNCMRSIPELRNIDDFTKDRYELVYYAYDGKLLTCYDTSYSQLKNEGDTRDERLANFEKTHDSLNKLICRFASIRGKKSTEWTPEDVTFPVYAFTVKSQYIGGCDRHGETFVWSNGYLITPSGNVYICDADFEAFTDELDAMYNASTYESEDLLKQSWSRPLLYANSEWHTENVQGNADWHEYQTYGLEAEVTEQYEEDGWPCVTIEIRNNGDKEWYYDDFQPFFYMGVLIDGKVYSVPKVEGSATYKTPLKYNSVLVPGDSLTIKYCPDDFFPLIPGEYKIIIPGRITDTDHCNVYADYIIR